VLAAAVNARITLIISGGNGPRARPRCSMRSFGIYFREGTPSSPIEDRLAELQFAAAACRPHGNASAQYRGQGRNPPNASSSRTRCACVPNRIILGECRGEEAFDMLQAMNTGHEGSMATVHANHAARLPSHASNR